MSRLLTPGINLMKKMNFLYKFGLISLAVLVPLMLLSALLVMQTSRDIGTIRAERVGIEHAKVALELRRLGGEAEQRVVRVHVALHARPGDRRSARRLEVEDGVRGGRHHAVGRYRLTVRVRQQRVDNLGPAHTLGHRGFVHRDAFHHRQLEHIT